MALMQNCKMTIEHAVIYYDFHNYYNAYVDINFVLCNGNIINGSDILLYSYN